MLLCAFFSAHHGQGFFRVIIYELELRKLFQVQRMPEFSLLWAWKLLKSFDSFNLVHKKIPSWLMKNSYYFVFGRPLSYTLILPNPRVME